MTVVQKHVKDMLELLIKFNKNTMEEYEKIASDSAELLESYAQRQIYLNIIKHACAVKENEALFTSLLSSIQKTDESNLKLVEKKLQDTLKFLDININTRTEATTETKVEKKISSSFTVLNDYWTSYHITKEPLKDLVASESSTHCNEFIPSFLKGLGEKVYKDILPDEGLDANALYEVWNTSSVMVNLNTWIQKTKNLPEKPEDVIQNQAAELANELVNKGYLVLAAASKRGGHVAVVAPQATAYKSLPERPEFSGSGLDSHQGGEKPVVVRDYPVFLQAGTYTGTVPPGYAFSRDMFNDNQVHFFIYIP